MTGRLPGAYLFVIRSASTGPVTLVLADRSGRSCEPLAPPTRASSRDVYAAGASWSLLTRTGRMATAIFKRARQAPLSGYLRPRSATFIDGVICRPQGRGNQAHDGGHGILPVGDIGSPHGRSFRGSPPGAIGSPHDPSRAHALVRAAAV